MLDNLVVKFDLFSITLNGFNCAGQAVELLADFAITPECELVDKNSGEMVCKDYHSLKAYTNLPKFGDVYVQPIFGYGRIIDFA